MNNKTSIMVWVAVVLAAVAAASSWVWWTSYQPKAQARELVSLQLKQPAIVHFDALLQDPASKAVCGLLTTRNDTGQYVRRSSFVVLASGQVWLEPADDSEASLAKVEVLEARNKPVFVALQDGHCPDFRHQIMA